MKPWFELHGNSDHGPYSRWLGFDAKPVVWQGWLLTGLYYAGLVAWFAVHLPRLGEEALAFGSLLLGAIFWHGVILWGASRRFAPVDP